MKSKPIPCKLCLVLAICRNKYSVECEVLYNWVWNNEQYSSKDMLECFRANGFLSSRNKSIAGNRITFSRSGKG